MAEIVPFRGILYNTAKVSGEDVVAPPYDIITPEYKDALYNKSPYNIVRIDFGKEIEGDNESANKYTRAVNYFNSWLRDNVLVRSKDPGFYAYEIEYKIKNQQKRLKGFFSLVRLVELGKGIYPHECTHSKPKTDRLNLTRACNANISPIFSLYNSPEKKASAIIENAINKSNPYIQAKDFDGAVHRLWIITDEKDIETIKNDLKGRAIYIADGHHRYETALEFQKEMSKGGIKGGVNLWDYVLMFLANISDEGITILPAHRLVKDIPANALSILSKYFDVEALPSKEKIADDILRYEHAIGFSQSASDRGNGRQYVLRYKGGGLNDLPPVLKGLDVTILHELIFKRLLQVDDITYEMNPEETLSMVKKGHFSAAFFLNPTKVEDVERVALSLVRMPPKSTYFYPKLLTGMVIYSFK